MRITLDIDDDVLLAAKELAKRERKTAGKFISDLLREAMGGRATGIPATSGLELYGLRPIPAGGAVVTNRLVNKLRDGLEV